MYRIVVASLLAVFTTFASAQSHGEINKQVSPWSIWHAESAAWISIDDFWQDFARQRGGLTWGRSATYPDYDKVNEFDTFIVVLPQGDCLMEFFHSRWRRANDVRRWDEAMNDYAGCPHVFD